MASRGGAERLGEVQFRPEPDGRAAFGRRCAGGGHARPALRLRPPAPVPRSDLAAFHAGRGADGRRAVAPPLPARRIAHPPLPRAPRRGGPRGPRGSPLPRALRRTEAARAHRAGPGGWRRGARPRRTGQPPRSHRRAGAARHPRGAAREAPPLHRLDQPPARRPPAPRGSHRLPRPKRGPGRPARSPAHGGRARRLPRRGSGVREISFWEAAFLWRDPLIAASLGAVLCALVGVFVVLRRSAFVGAAVGQASSLGVVLAFLAPHVLGASVPPLFAGLATGAISAALFGLSGRKGRLGVDAA